MAINNKVSKTKIFSYNEYADHLKYTRPCFRFPQSPGPYFKAHFITGITDAGKAFFALILQGGIEIITSNTGKQYITIRITINSWKIWYINVESLSRDRLPSV
jgi:hypothetical protein